MTSVTSATGMHEADGSPTSMKPGPKRKRLPRSAVCNGKLIRLYRERCGWTQIQFAELSGFSRRLIAKAEAGGPLDGQTIEIIAATFAESGITVSAADLLVDPAELTRQFLRNYVKYQADCVQQSLAFVSRDIVAFIDGDPATNPIAGEYQGIDEFDQFWRKFFTLFVRDGGTLENPEIVVSGNEVIAWGHESIRVASVPEQPLAFVMLRIRFESGLMVRFEDYYECSGMMRALRHWVDEYPDAEWIKLLRVEAIKSLP